MPTRSTFHRVARGGEAFFRTLAGLCAVLMVPIVLLITGSWLTGSQLAVVETGSMDPAMPRGSLLVTSPISADQADEGMVVEFVDPSDPDRLVTHRIVGVQRNDSGDLSFITRGDANSSRDQAPVPAANIRAKVRWHVKDLGSALSVMQWPRSLIFVALPTAMLVLATLLGRLAGERSTPGTAGPGSPVQLPCSACGMSVADADRYCRHCGLRRVAAKPLVMSVVDLSDPARHATVTDEAPETGGDECGGAMSATAVGDFDTTECVQV